MAPVTAHSGHSTKVDPVVSSVHEYYLIYEWVLFVPILISMKLKYRITELGSKVAMGPLPTNVPWFSQSHMALSEIRFWKGASNCAF